MEPAPKVLVALGWDRLLREIVAAALSNHGWQVVGSQTQISQSGDVDLVLVYYSRPTAVAIEDVQRARVEYPSARIVLLGGEITDAELLRFIEAGVGAYVDTHQGLPELLDAMQMVRENRSPSSGRITHLVLENISRLTRQRDTQADARLTLREKEILYLITTGLSNKEIACHLSIAPNTVKNHVHNILEKLNVGSRHEAVWMETRWSRHAVRSPVVRNSTRP